MRVRKSAITAMGEEQHTILATSTLQPKVVARVAVALTIVEHREHDVL